MQASPTHKDRSFWLRRALPWLVFFGLALALGTVRAHGTDWPNEYAKRVRSTEQVSPLNDEAFGDKGQPVQRHGALQPRPDLAAGQQRLAGRAGHLLRPVRHHQRVAQEKSSVDLFGMHHSTFEGRWLCR